jgi:hypothetical protein
MCDPRVIGRRDRRIILAAMKGAGNENDGSRDVEGLLCFTLRSYAAQSGGQVTRSLAKVRLDLLEPFTAGLTTVLAQS